MPLPQRPIVVAALAVAYAATAHAQRHTSDTSASAAATVRSFASTFAAAYAVCAVLYAVYAVFIYPHYLSPLRHLPQPADGNHFLLGQFPRMIHVHAGKPALEWINTIPNDGLIRYRGVFNQDRLLVTTPKALADVLVARNYDFAKPQVVRDSLEQLLGAGILMAEGDAHRQQRKQLAPAFAFRYVKELHPVFWAKGCESARAMEAAMRGAVVAAEPSEGDKQASPTTAPLEMAAWASRTTLDIIGLAGLGRDFATLQDPDNELAVQYRTMFNPSRGVRSLVMLGLVLPRWLLRLLPLRRSAAIETANAHIKQVCRDLIEAERQGDHKQNNDKHHNILSVALASGAFSDDALVAQLITFLAAGHETESAALTWAVYLLCCHPHVQTRLRAEIRAQVPSLDAAAAVDIDQMPYLTAVCSEVLRFMAPVPTTSREALVDTEIQGQYVPRGTLITVAPWAVNRSVALWGPTATQFDPERWLSGETHGSYKFLTFLHGPRSCIGMGFARAELACVLAAWVGRFAFRLQDPADADEDVLGILGSVASRPKNGLHVYASVVEGW